MDTATGASATTHQSTGAPPSAPHSAPPTTVMASDAEVSNGFVKNGTSLPYVIETNQSGTVDCAASKILDFNIISSLGNKKRSPKLLPVCGICGKQFVCTTTMKRHLVIHTGERPFNCKICGKQYTQKGNLRVSSLSFFMLTVVTE